jgi:hypothetical protein
MVNDAEEGKIPNPNPKNVKENPALNTKNSSPTRKNVAGSTILDRSKIRRARRKTLRAQHRARINLILPKYMKNEWLDLAGELDLSLSQLIRSAVEKFQGGIETPESTAMKVDLSEKSPVAVNGKNPDKNLMKKRIRGLIKLQKNRLPLGKLALVLEKPRDFVEVMIYELAAEQIVDGDIKEDVFEFTNDPNEIITILCTMIDKM